MADLGGRVVAFLEARRADDMASLVTRHGGIPLSAPSLQSVHEPHAPELAHAVEVLCQPGTSVALFLTGIGVDAIFEAARFHHREPELLTALARQQIAVRGPKPAAALRKRGVRIDAFASTPHTTAELLAALAGWDLAGQTVAVQLFGGPNPTLRAALEQRGARVEELSPYAWDRPSDPAPVLHLIDAIADGAVDVLLVTSAQQVANLLGIARDAGREGVLRAGIERVAVGAQGPVVRGALEQARIQVAFEPSHVHMGGLVLEAARYLAAESVAKNESERTVGSRAR